jgi:hypothetical protein
MFPSFGLARFCHPKRFLFLLIHIVLLDEHEHHHWKNSSLRLKAATSKQVAKASRSIRLASSTFEDVNISIGQNFKKEERFIGQR